jgi:hypothetical protein
MLHVLDAQVGRIKAAVCYLSLRDLCVNFLRLLMLAVLAAFHQVSVAGHPLVTEDMGLIGQGVSQFEWNVDYSKRRESEEGVTSATLSRGLSNRVDLFVTFNHAWKVADGSTGLADSSVGAKALLFEGPFLFGVKGEIILPTGDALNGLGNGRLSQAITFISDYPLEWGNLIVNLGLTHNKYRFETDTDVRRKFVRKYSVAVTKPISEALTFLIDAGVEDSTIRSERHERFLILGLARQHSSSLDSDLGIKLPLELSGEYFQVGMGFTKRFN